MSKYLLLIIFIPFVCQSCRPLEGDKTYYLSSEYKTNLKDKELLIYENQYNKRDTFVVTSVMNGYWKTSTTGTWDKPPFDIFEFQNTYINNIHDSIDDWIEQEISVQGNYYGDSNKPPKTLDRCICIVNGLYDISVRDGTNYGSELSWYKVWKARISNNIKIQKELKIRNRIFYNVYQFSSDTSKIKNIYFTFKDGFIRYELTDGDIWEIIN